MQTRIGSFFLLAFFSLAIFSCKKTNKLGLQVPKDAAMVFHVNGKAINSKISWDEMKQNTLFQEALSDSSISAVSKAAMENPENTGVDIQSDMICYLKNDADGGYFVFEGALKDAEKFKKFTVEAAKGASVTEKNGMSMLKNDRVLTTWKKDRFLVIADIPEMKIATPAFNRNDSGSTVTTAASIRNLEALAPGLYEVKEAESMGKDSRFGQVMELEGDMHFWINSEILMKNTPAMGAMSMLNISKLYNGNATGGAVNFENGKIVANTLSFAGKEMLDIWKKYSGSKINADMVKRLPGNDVVGMVALNFKPQGLLEIVKLTGMDGLINMGTAQMGFNLDDFVKANGGDLFFAATDLKADSTGKAPDVNMLFSVSIGDKAAFEKLLAAGKKMGANEASAFGKKMAYNANDKFFAIGNNKENIDKFIAGGTNANIAMLDKISGSPMGGFIDFQKIFPVARPEAMRDSLEFETFKAMEKVWENMLFTGGQMKGDAMSGHFEVNLKDKNVNSLKQLNGFMADMAKIEKAKKARRLSVSYDDVDYSDLKVEDVPVIMAPVEEKAVKTP
ncbi:MAG: DUF4836 family protein [Ferruginibacter sp.]